jgi:hypothetical protein
MPRVDQSQDLFRPAQLGSSASLVVVNDLWPLVSGRPSLAGSYRVVGLSVTPAERGQGQDMCTLIFDPQTDV